MKFKKIILCSLVLIITTSAYFNYTNYQTITTMVPLEQKTIVIDAGHGGFDPGKTGTTGKNEKDINLAIANKLQGYLEQSGAVVFLSRANDEALGSSKKQDMRERKNIANESEGDLLISIHQNSFTSPTAKGAQVFYYNASTSGKLLAEKIQVRLKTEADPANTRQAKSNTNYYILKKPNIATALVECGFLSNPQEEQLLNSEEYQQKIAWAIYLGILDYLQTEDVPQKH